MTSTRSPRRPARVATSLAAASLVFAAVAIPVPVRNADARSVAGQTAQRSESTSTWGLPQGSGDSVAALTSSAGDGGVARRTIELGAMLQSDDLAQPGERLMHAVSAPALTTLDVLVPEHAPAAAATIALPASPACGAAAQLRITSTAAARTLVGQYFPGQLERSATPRLLLFVFDDAGSLVGRAESSPMADRGSPSSPEAARPSATRPPNQKGIIDSMKMGQVTAWSWVQVGGGFCATQLGGGSFRWPPDLQTSGSMPRVTTDIEMYEWYDFDPGVVGPAAVQVALLRLKRGS